MQRRRLLTAGLAAFGSAAIGLSARADTRQSDDVIGDILDAALKAQDADAVKAAASAAAQASSPVATAPVSAGAAERTLSVLNLHTGEKLTATYFEKGAYLSDAVGEVSKVLKDYRTGDVYPIDPHVLDILAGLNRQLGGAQPIQIICGYRSPKTNAMLAARSNQVAKHSLHMDGKAIDMRLEGVSLADLRRAALNMGKGGVGYYPVSDFVHVDVGRVRTWQGT